MTEEDLMKEFQRKDDAMLRKFVGGVGLAVVIQALGMIYYAGQFSNQVANNTRAITTLSATVEKSRDIEITMAQFKQVVDDMNHSVKEMSSLLAKVAAEQQRRGPIIEQLQRKTK